MKPHESRGLWLGLLGVVIFALTLPMTRLAVGTPESVAAVPASYTGRYLAPLLKR